METVSAADFLPKRRALADLSAAAGVCQGCSLYRRASQTVFGAGHAGAWLMLIGEQPGDREDREGLPFVGPAGNLLNSALAEAQIAREEVYVTNAVKHFKWTAVGPRRLHKKPSEREIAACRPWLLAEAEAVRPKAVVCLGASAALGAFGHAVPIQRRSGRPASSLLSPLTWVTLHPAAILRLRAQADREHYRREYESLVADLSRIRDAAYFG